MGKYRASSTQASQARRSQVYEKGEAQTIKDKDDQVVPEKSEDEDGTKSSTESTTSEDDSSGMENGASEVEIGKGDLWINRRRRKVHRAVEGSDITACGFTLAAAVWERASVWPTTEEGVRNYTACIRAKCFGRL